MGADGLSFPECHRWLHSYQCQNRSVMASPALPGYVRTQFIVYSVVWHRGGPLQGALLWRWDLRLFEKDLPGAYGVRANASVQVARARSLAAKHANLMLINAHILPARTALDFSISADLPDKIRGPLP